MDWLEASIVVASGVVVLCLVALLLRKLLLWYWRISKIVSLLESIDESLKALPAVRQMRAEAQRREQTRKA